MADNSTQIRITAKDETRAAIQSATSGLRGIQDAARNMTSVLAGLGASLSVGAFAAGIKSVIDGADHLAKASQKYGVAVEQLSALQYAGKLADVSLEAIGNGLKKLSVNMLDTAAGTGEAKDAFKALGIEVKTTDGSLKASDTVLSDIADRFAGMEDGAGKTALAVKLFGRAGADLIPLLNQGSRGLAEMKAEAEKLGVVVGGDLARKSEEFNDNLTRIGASLDALKLSLAGGVINDLNDFTAALVASTKAAGGLLKGLTLLGGDQAKNPVRALEEVEKRLSSLKKLRDEIEQSAANSSVLRDIPFLGTAGDLKNLERQIEFAEKQRAALLDLSSQRGAFDFGPPVMGGGKGAAPILPDNAASRTAAAAAKKAVDELRKAFEDANKAIYEHALAAAEADAEIEKLRNHYTDLVEPAAATMRELQKFEDLAPALGLSADQVERIRDAFQEKIDVEQYGKPLREITEEISQQGNLARDLGMTFSSAFEDAVVSGKKFQDVLQGLAQDIARLFVRQAFTSLIGNLFGGAGGAGGGGFFSGLSLPSFDVGTSYVPRDMIAQVHKGEAIIPAAFNKSDGAEPMRVTINNYGQSQVSTRERVVDGRRELEVIVEDIVTGWIGRGGADGVMGQAYGAGRRGVLRG